MIASAQAAANNAYWCDAICCAHGAPGELHEHLWLSRRPMPRFYWTTIGEPEALRDWEAAWNGIPADHASPPLPDVFLPTLLADPDIQFVAAYRDQQVVAGAIANRSGDVVGVSNMFAHADTERSWAGCLATIRSAWSA